jgi:hypothetical protein
MRRVMALRAEARRSEHGQKATSTAQNDPFSRDKFGHFRAFWKKVSDVLQSKFAESAG